MPEKLIDNVSLNSQSARTRKISISSTAMIATDLGIGVKIRTAHLYQMYFNGV